MPNVSSITWAHYFAGKRDGLCNDVEIISHLLERISQLDHISPTLKKFRLYVVHSSNAPLVENVLVKMIFLEELALHIHATVVNFSKMLQALSNFTKLRTLSISMFSVHHVKVLLARTL